MFSRGALQIHFGVYLLYVLVWSSELCYLLIAMALMWPMENDAGLAPPSQVFSSDPTLQMYAAPQFCYSEQSIVR